MRPPLTIELRVGDATVVWPLHVRVSLTPERELPCEAAVIDADGRILAEYFPSLDDIITGDPVSVVVAQAQGLITRWAQLHSDGLTAASPYLSTFPIEENHAAKMRTHLSLEREKGKTCEEDMVSIRKSQTRGSGLLLKEEGRLAQTTNETPATEEGAAREHPLTVDTVLAPLWGSVLLGIIAGLSASLAVGRSDMALGLMYSGGQVMGWYTVRTMVRGIRPRWWLPHWDVSEESLSVLSAAADTRWPEQPRAPRAGPAWMTPVRMRRVLQSLAWILTIAAGCASLLSENSWGQTLALVPGTLLWHWGWGQMVPSASPDTLLADRAESLVSEGREPST